MHGNCPRRCHNCGKYFLLTAGYNTCCCNITAPGETSRTCRKVGAHNKAEKEKASKTPAQRECRRAYNRLKARRACRKFQRRSGVEEEGCAGPGMEGVSRVG
ncbi:DUF6076 domain-containing protein [Acutalibacter intestini]|uniref:DUF6076 domain-containing protein n=1 Tax=Acutalibacter intestini TaxID=3093659 RepID=UPI00345F3605